MTPKDAAAWMVTEVGRAGVVDHATVVAHLLTADPALVAYNDAGNPKIAKPVLAAFNKRQGDDIVWSRSGLHWRKREHGDQAGRMVD